MISVFTVILFDDPTELTQVKDSKKLFTDYSEVTKEQVTLSNEFYRSMRKGEEIREAFRQDLKMTYSHLENNIDHIFLSKYLETYLGHQVVQQDGPLLFKIMIDNIQVNTEKSIKHILKLLENLKLNELKGENITQAFLINRRGLQRLEV